MRLLIAITLTLISVAYGLGAFFLYQQETWAARPREEASSAQLRHPDALLARIREAFASDNFSPDVLPLLRAALEEAPASYQSSFLLAAFHANRLERPERVRQAFAAALARYPANGRLHLTYAHWLISATRAASSAEVEKHVRRALTLEPALTGAGVELLIQSRVPVERWADLIPSSPAAQRELVASLLRNGRREQALNILERELELRREPPFLEEATFWAESAGEEGLALRAAKRWLEVELASPPLGRRYGRAAHAVARLLLARGDLEEAYATFRAALDRLETAGESSSSAAAELLSAMAYEYLHRNQSVIAESLFLEARDRAPYYVPAVLGLARTYRRQRDLPAAIREYQKVLTLDPERDDAKRELAEVVLQEGRRRGASP